MSTDTSRSAETPRAVDVDGDLDAVIEAHETVDWTEVPGISVPEAAAWTSRLIEAHDDLEAQR